MSRQASGHYVKCIPKRGRVPATRLFHLVMGLQSTAAGAMTCDPGSPWSNEDARNSNPVYLIPRTLSPLGLSVLLILTAFHRGTSAQRLLLYTPPSLSTPVSAGTIYKVDHECVIVFFPLGILFFNRKDDKAGQSDIRRMCLAVFCCCCNSTAPCS